MDLCRGLVHYIVSSMLLVLVILSIAFTPVCSSSRYTLSLEKLIAKARDHGFEWFIVVDYYGNPSSPREYTVYNYSRPSGYSLLIIMVQDYRVSLITRSLIIDSIRKYNSSVIVIAILPTLDTEVDVVSLEPIVDGLRGFKIGDERYYGFTEAILYNGYPRETVVYYPIVFNDACNGTVEGVVVYRSSDNVLYEKPFYISYKGYYGSTDLYILGDALMLLNPWYGDFVGYDKFIDRLLIIADIHRDCRGIVVYDYIGLNYPIQRSVSINSSSSSNIEIPSIHIVSKIPPKLLLSIIVATAITMLLAYAGVSSYLFRSRVKVDIEGIIPFRIEGERAPGPTSEYRVSDPLEVILRIRERVSEPDRLLPMLYSFVEELFITRFGVKSLDSILRDNHLLYDIACRLGVNPGYLRRELLFLKKMYLRALGLSYTPLSVDWDRVVDRIFDFIKKVAG